MSADTLKNTMRAISTVSQHDAGQRIDNYLFSKLKNLPKSRIYRMLRKGEVRINSKRVQVHYRLNEHDLLRLPPFIESVILQQKSQNSNPKSLPSYLKNTLLQSILYEDQNLLIINKPSGLAVHGGSGLSFGLIESLRLLWPDQPYMELVHRLDRDTSGCVMVAKSRKCLVELHQLLKTNQIKKQYQALVTGKWQGGRKVSAPLRKQTLKSGERMVRVQPDGQPSETLFKICQKFKNHTLMDVQPITGRTHQIRVHATFMGHPILGDEKYGDKAQNKLAKQFKLNRLFLHAKALEVPLQSGLIKVEAPLPNECTAYLNQLEQIEDDS